MFESYVQCSNQCSNLILWANLHSLARPSGSSMAVTATHSKVTTAWLSKSQQLNDGNLPSAHHTGVYLWVYPFGSTPLGHSHHGGIPRSHRCQPSWPPGRPASSLPRPGPWFVLGELGFGSSAALQMSGARMPQIIVLAGPSRPNSRIQLWVVLNLTKRSPNLSR